MHLDIDEEQEKAKAYWYPFTPQQGNVMHCMPKHGTKAWLKMGSRNDGDSVVEHCHRTNGQNCGDMSDYNNRYFTTEFGKRMAMLPDLLYFHAESNMIRLQDQNGMLATTGKEINIHARGRMQFYARRQIVFDTPEQVMIEKTNRQSGFEISGNQLHVRSKFVLAKGNTDAQVAAAPRDTIGKSVTMPLDLAYRLAALVPIVVDDSALK